MSHRGPVLCELACVACGTRSVDTGSVGVLLFPGDIVCPNVFECERG